MNNHLVLMSNSRKKFLKALAGTFTLGWLFNSKAEAKPEEKPAALSVDPLVGQIAIFPYSFTPRNWLPCEGQILVIQQYQSLYSLLGNSFGGSAQSGTFALPDLRGRTIVGQGSGIGLTATAMGEMRGSESVTLATNQLPSHSHDLNVSSAAGTTHIAQGNVPATNRDGILHYASSANTIASSGTIGNTGGGQPVNVMQPSLTLRYFISIAGTFPSQS